MVRGILNRTVLAYEEKLFLVWVFAEGAEASIFYQARKVVYMSCSCDGRTEISVRPEGCPKGADRISFYYEYNSCLRTGALCTGVSFLIVNQCLCSWMMMCFIMEILGGAGGTCDDSEVLFPVARVVRTELDFWAWK